MDQINRVLFVTKRDGTKQDFNPKKLELLLYKLCFNLAKKYLSVEKVIEHIRSGLYDGVNTKEIITLLAETVAQMTSHHPDYAILAGRLAIVDLHKNTKEKFTDVISDLYNIKDEDTGAHEPIISKKHYTFAIANADRLNEAIAQERDLEYSYFAYKTLERSYLLKLNGKIAERPQHLLMRVAIGIHADDIDAAIETYDLMSKKYFTHASPTMFSAATCRAQLSSCFLLSVTEDSVKGICGETLSRTTEITKYGGGIGLNFHCVRAKGTKIKGTSGISKGIVPFLRLYNCAALAIDQSGNKRPGSMAIYLEPWHADIKDFLNLKKNTGVENDRARDLFYALWIPDLFMKRVEADDVWSLMCPHECPGLFDCWGNEFDELYQKYEKEKRYKEQVKARDIWYKIYESQVETGTPYMLYKDACNRKSNQQNLGTIRCSNLCTEIMEYCDRDEIAVCNLASIALNKFVVDENTYDFNMLKHMAKVLTINLNKIIDINYYPEPEAERSNRRHRPIGIGVQGLADVFMLMKCGYESEKAQKLNMEIFETIYYGALEASCELAEKYGTYETYAGSPVSKGILQFDMWEVTPTALWNWNSLKEKISKNGVRNSLLIAPMPTASTAQILGNNESFEPYTSNIYTRRVLSGEFQVVNPHLVNELIKLNLWNEDMRNQLVANYGSVQNITSIPEAIRETYKTVWEISVKTTIKMAADRGAFIDQSQSFNIHVAQPTYMKMSSIHFYAWKMGLKTGMYYLRTKPAANAIQFTVDKDRLKTAQLVCSRENKDDCLMCGA